MKITKTQLKQIIKEELAAVLDEGTAAGVVDTGAAGRQLAANIDAARSPFQHTVTSAAWGAPTGDAYEEPLPTSSITQDDDDVVVVTGDDDASELERVGVRNRPLVRK